MSIGSPQEEQAVFFFEGHKLVRQLLWLEFEAVLDGFVPLVEQASQEVQAVYLTVTPGPEVAAAVFFTINFDKNGFADQRWNIPLEQLCSAAAEGPDLGHGPIKLACRSQCPISWYEEQLWNPELQGEKAHFSTIVSALAANRLNLGLAEPDEMLDDMGQTGEYPVTGPRDRRAEQEVKELQLVMATLQERQRQDIEQLRRQHQQEVEALKSELDESSALVVEQRSKIAGLEEVIGGLKVKIGGLRDYFEHKFDRIKSSDKAALSALTQQHELEKEEAVREAVSELKETVQVRDIELMYRDTQLSTLQEEVERLQKEKQDLLENSGNKLLSRLHSQGISFVTFQPGAGQFNVPLDTLIQFMEDRVGYVAQRCGVDKTTYQQWLDHFKRPLCNAVVDGKLCHQTVERVHTPSEFQHAVSDRCANHRQQTASAEVLTST